MDESRKQFEEWVKFHLDDRYSEVPLYKNKGGSNYLDSQVDLAWIAWIAWQASRAAIEIELPGWDMFDTTRQVLGAVEDELRSAGIKVKE